LFKKLIISLLLLLCVSCTPAEVQWYLSTDKESQDPITKQIIINAADEFGVKSNLLLEIARCESGYNITAKNGHSSARGLFQFIDTTWASNLFRFNYVLEDIYNPVAQARTAAQMIAEGGLFNWDESKPCWRHAQ
jgi:soluble lytic murein transglycosylase-like protein